MERGQGGHVETEEQAEKEAEQSAERSLKLSSPSLPFSLTERQRASDFDLFPYLVHGPPHPLPAILVLVAASAVAALDGAEQVVDVAVLRDAVMMRTAAQFITRRVAVDVGFRPHGADP